MSGVMCIYVGTQHELIASEIYRGNSPLFVLGQQKTWQTGWGFYDLIHQHGAQMWKHLMANADIFVFPRMFIHKDAPQEMREAFFELFEILRSAGKKIVYEVDDDFTNEFRHVVDGDAITVASMADAITVTTPMLAKRMQKLTGRPAYVLPNCIDSQLWDSPRYPITGYREDHTIVGLSGSTTHKEDWKVLETVLPSLLDAHPTMELWLTGFHPDYLKGLERTWYLPGMPYFEYVQMVKYCDIVLAPVDPNDGFNMGKSPIKVLEGMAANAAVVATDMPVYQLAIRHEDTGLLTQHTPQDWYQTLDRLLTDEALLARLRANGKRFALRHHDIHTQWKLWSKAYHQILKQPKFSPQIRSKAS